MEFLKRLKMKFLSRFVIEQVSEQWLQAQIYSEGIQGWLDGPRWKFPKELKAGRRLVQIGTRIKMRKTNANK